MTSDVLTLNQQGFMAMTDNEMMAVDGGGFWDALANVGGFLLTVGGVIAGAAGAGALLAGCLTPFGAVDYPCHDWSSNRCRSWDS